MSKSEVGRGGGPDRVFWENKTCHRTPLTPLCNIKYGCVMSSMASTSHYDDYNILPVFRGTTLTTSSGKCWYFLPFGIAVRGGHCKRRSKFSHRWEYTLNLAHTIIKSKYLSVYISLIEEFSSEVRDIKSINK